MASTLIQVLNESTVVVDTDAANVAAALQTQVSSHFAPIWGSDATITFVPAGGATDPAAWQLVILDDSDQADALGYHETTAAGLPLGKVFAKSDKQDGLSWSVTASHELLEMLGDPYINLAAYDPNAQQITKLYAYEVCDAVEADQYGYMIGDVLVSDFVYPGWFEAAVPSGALQYDYQKQVAAAFQLLAGGYIGIYDLTSNQGWQQLQADRDAAVSRAEVRRGSRRDRRMMKRVHWRRSTERRESRYKRGFVPSRSGSVLARNPNGTIQAGEVTIRPCLPPARFDPNSAKDADLDLHGIPPRPDAERQPRLRDLWNVIYSKPLKFVAPEFRERLNVKHGPRQDREASDSSVSDNWAGSVCFQQDGSAPFGAIYGIWTVPNTTSSQGSGIPTFSSAWIGIDGDQSPNGVASTDVFQAGTEQDATQNGTLQTTYYAWWEWYPNPSYQISNFNVTAGDEVACILTVKSPTSGNLSFVNMSANPPVHTSFDFSAPAKAGFKGNCAEWIVERPEINKLLSLLADFGAVIFTGSYAGSGANEVGADTGTLITMNGDTGTAIASTQVSGNQSIEVTFQP